MLSRIETFKVAKDSVAEVGEALWAHRNVAYGAFDYYACLMTENSRSLTDGRGGHLRHRIQCIHRVCARLASSRRARSNAGPHLDKQQQDVAQRAQ